MTNYEKSNSIRELNVKFSAEAKSVYKEVRGLDWDSAVEYGLLKLKEVVCRDLKLGEVQLSLLRTEPHRNTKRGTLKSKLHGLTNCNDWIKLWTITAKRKQKRSVKGLVETLLHEINHIVDRKILKIASIHSGGFYYHLGELDSEL